MVPLKNLLDIFDSSLHLLQVKTPKLKSKDLTIAKELHEIKTTFSLTENETIYQGLLLAKKEMEADLACVIRRNKGFFSQLWDQYTVKKEDFESSIPLLILKGAI